MKKTQQFLNKLDLPAEDNHSLKVSNKRFPDGGYWRFEIPSVEGPRVFREVSVSVISMSSNRPTLPWYPLFLHAGLFPRW